MVEKEKTKLDKKTGKIYCPNCKNETYSRVWIERHQRPTFCPRCKRLNKW